MDRFAGGDAIAPGRVATAAMGLELALPLLLLQGRLGGGGAPGAGFSQAPLLVMLPVH